MFMHSSCERLAERAPAALRRMGQAGCLILGLPGLAAAGVFTPPQGCTLTMTVQQRSCTVAQHYTCAADAPGDQWVTYFTREGEVYRSRIDAETRWMESTDLVAGVSEALDSEADPASLTALIDTGRDDYDFWTVTDRGERVRFVGHDVLDGTAVIDGVTLATTRFELRLFAESGDLISTRTGGQFVDRENRRFYGGAETTVDWQGERGESNDSPVRFIRPGQPGFGSVEPQYDCDAQMVRAAPEHSPTGAARGIVSKEPQA